jgi:hypothetical protein
MYPLENPLSIHSIAKKRSAVKSTRRLASIVKSVQRFNFKEI